MSGISCQEAVNVLNISTLPELLQLFSKTSSTREKFYGTKVATCAIINARSGNCPENCAFCSQSSRSNAEIIKFPLVSAEEMFSQAQQAEEYGAHRYGIVTSGRAVNMSKELDEICRAVSMIKEQLNIKVCASLGILNKESLQQLKNAGLDRYHHNLEASKSYFPEICTTRKFEDQLQTISFAKEAGLSLCVGGIFGLGESKEQRIEMLDNIRELHIESVPINFLTPIKGTLLEKNNELSALDCLKIIAAAKLMMPEVSIRICGGREYNLGEMQSLVFAAGAEAIMIGSYLTTSGRNTQTDLKMIKDAGLIHEPISK